MLPIIGMWWWWEKKRDLAWGHNTVFKILKKMSRRKKKIVREIFKAKAFPRKKLKVNATEPTNESLPSYPQVSKLPYFSYFPCHTLSRWHIDRHPLKPHYPHSNIAISLFLSHSHWFWPSHSSLGFSLSLFLVGSRSLYLLLSLSLSRALVLPLSVSYARTYSLPRLAMLPHFPFYVAVLMETHLKPISPLSFCSSMFEFSRSSGVTVFFLRNFSDLMIITGIKVIFTLLRRVVECWILFLVFRTIFRSFANFINLKKKLLLNVRLFKA